MVPKIHAKGHSFAGIAKYVLHDKDRATTSDRVAWTATHNLATEDPHVAWRIMVATALDQNRLKEQAAVKATGRKSSAHVMHYTLSWHADEAEGLTREEMLRAALDSLTVLGRDATSKHRRQFADEHQAMIVCHNDKSQPHVHVIVNRIHPEHGVMLPSSKEKLNFSRWAQEYEKQRDNILCEQRVFNNAARDRGEYVRGEKDKPRHILELEEKHAHRQDANSIREQQREKDLELSRRTREAREQREEAWKRLRKSFRREKQAIQDQTRRRIKGSLASVREDFTPEWKKLYRNQRRELYEFAQREKSFMGRIHNALSTVTLRSIMHGENRGAVLRDLFSALTAKGVRLGALKKKHLTIIGRLESSEKQARNQTLQKERNKEKAKLAQHRQTFQEQREELVAQHEGERSEIREAWKARRQERLKAWNERVAERDFNKAARNVDPRKGRGDQRSRDRKSDPRRGKPRDTGRDRSP